MLLGCACGLLTSAVGAEEPAPDLTVNTVQGPAAGFTGSSISVVNEVENRGATLARAFSVGIYLSADADITGDDLLLGTWHVDQLAAGASRRTTNALALNASLPAGTFYVGSIADVWQEISEAVETNNALAGEAIAIQIGPDLVMDAVAGPSSGSTGDTLPVTNVVRNAGVGAADGFTVAFYLSPDATITSSDTLLGTRNVPRLAAGQTSAMTNWLPVSIHLEPGTYFLGAIADSSAQIAEADETNNALAGPAVEIVAGPDLVMSALSGPATGATGSSVTLTNTVENVGLGEAGPFSIGFYLSTDQTITPQDTLLGTRNLNQLAAGTASADATVLSLGGYLIPGTYYLGAMADFSAQVVEADESNNVLVDGPIEIQIGPDLEISQLSGPTTGLTGESIPLTNTVRNAGTGNAASFRVGFYLSPDATITSDDILLGLRTLGALAAGQDSDNTIQLALPATLPPGAYYLGAIADLAREIAEADEANNALATGPIDIQPGADLVMVEVSGPVTAPTGSSLGITNTVENTRSAEIGPFAIGLYLSADDQITTNDLLLGVREVPGLAAGARSTDVNLVPLSPELTPGTYFLGAIADFREGASEADENNNTLTGATVDIQAGPDLVIADLTGPATGATAGTLQLTNTIENIGQGDAGPFVVGFYLSTDPAFSADDLRLGERAVSGLAAGQSSRVVTILPLDASLTPGTYYLAAAADDRDEVGEADETNNTLLGEAIQIEIGPDLGVTLVAGPASGVTGGSLLLTNTVRNTGTAPAGRFTVSFYLSTDADITPADVLLGSREVTALAAQTSSAATNALTLSPLLPPGDYFLGAIVDVTGDVIEADEANNALAGERLALALGPDLVLTLLSGPASGATGGTLALTNAVQNAGAGAAGSFLVGFYLSADDTITPADLLLGSRALNQLAAGATSEETTLLPLGGNLAPGAYFLGAIADYSAQVNEADESNNALPGSQIQIQLGPDLIITEVAGPATGLTGGSITVTNTVHNAGTGNASSFVVGIYLSPDPVITRSDVLLGTRAVAGLAAGQSDSAAGAFPVGAGLAPGTYYVGALADYAAEVSEADEANNALAGATIDVRPGPDLVTRDVAGPATGLTGGAITVTNTVQNTGTGAAAAFKVGFYLSADAIITPDDLLAGAMTVPGLDAGQSLTTTQELKIDPTLAPGVYYLGIIADYTAEVSEESETNNALAGATIEFLPGADLVMAEAKGPAVAFTGSQLYLTNSVVNAGEGDASAFQVGFYLSADATITTNDLLLAARLISGLEAGQQSTATNALLLRTTVAPGTYYLGAIADYRADAHEATRTNNALASAVVDLRIGPDLEMTAVRGPATGLTGDSITLTNTIRNTGDGTADPFLVGFYLSADATITADDQLLGSRWINGLNAGNESTEANSLVIPAGVAPGAYYLGALADYAEQVAEASETNNALTEATIDVQSGADLVPSTLTGSSTGLLTGEVTVTYRVANTGSGDAAAAAVGFYLSADTNITTDDTLLGRIALTPLIAGQSSAASATFTVTNTVAPGAYFWGLIVDDLAVAAETDETNNAQAGNAIVIDVATLASLPSRIVKPTPGGIDPRPYINAFSPTQLTGFGFGGGPFQVQSSPSLASAVWSNVGPELNTNFFALDLPPAEPQTFYRVCNLFPNPNYAAATRCAGCHGSVFTSWNATPHATALETLKAIGQGDNSSCLPCHTVGFGFERGFLNETLTPKLAGVQCENCHGPAGNHPSNPGLLVKRPAKEKTSMLCGGCHTDAHHPTYDEWAATKHAGVDEHVAGYFLNPARSRPMERACGPCHSGAVRLALLDQLDGGPNPPLPTGADAAALGVECIVCHDPHGATTNEHQLRHPLTSTAFYSYSTSTSTSFAEQYDPNIQICAQCHNLRGARPTDTSRPPHHSPQYNMLIGDVGVDYGNFFNSFHASRFFQNQCVTCHMPTTEVDEPTDENPNYTGHGFSIQANSCLPCHSNGEQRKTAVQTEIRGLIASLKDTLDVWATTQAPEELRNRYGALAWEYTHVGELSDPEGAGLSGPTAAEQAAVPDAIKEARFNMYLVAHDGSYGVHNANYARHLLQVALNKVTPLINVP